MTGNGETSILSGVFDTDDPYFLSKLFEVDNQAWRPGINGGNSAFRDTIRNVPVRKASEIPDLKLDYTTGFEEEKDPEDDSNCKFPESSITKLNAGAAANAENIAKALNLGQECVVAATVDLGSEVPKNWLESLLGTDASELKGNMNSSGCGDFSTSLNNIFNEMSSLKCQMSKTQSSEEITFNTGSSIKILFVAPDPRTREGIEAVTDRLTRQLQFYMGTQPKVREYADLPITYYNAALSAWRTGFNELTRNIDAWLKDNPISITVRNTTINAKINNLSKIFISTDISTEAEADVILSVENIATETAVMKIQEALGMNAMPANARTYIQSQVSNQTTSRQDQIISQINQNKITVNSNDEIYLEIQGSVSDSVINAEIANQYDIKIHTAMKSSMSIGETVAANIVAGIKIEQELIVDSGGLDDAWEDVLDSGTERTKIRKDASKSFWSGLFTSTTIVLIVAAIVAAIAAYYYLKSQSPGGLTKSFMKFGRRYR